MNGICVTRTCLLIRTNEGGSHDQNQELGAHKGCRRDVEEFPKYTTQVVNLANQNAQGTRPRMVGQMSDLIQEFDGGSYREWVEWYGKRMPDAIENATERIYEMIENLRGAMGLIDKDLVRRWVRDLVLTKTFIGFRCQESVLKKIENLKAVLSLHFWHYNFMRIHKTPRVTSCMEAGITDHVWG